MSLQRNEKPKKTVKLLPKSEMELNREFQSVVNATMSSYLYKERLVKEEEDNAKFWREMDSSYNIQEAKKNYYSNEEEEEEDVETLASSDSVNQKLSAELQQIDDSFDRVKLYHDAIGVYNGYVQPVVTQQTITVIDDIGLTVIPKTVRELVKTASLIVADQISEERLKERPKNLKKPICVCDDAHVIDCPNNLFYGFTHGENGVRFSVEEANKHLLPMSYVPRADVDDLNTMEWDDEKEEWVEVVQRHMLKLTDMEAVKKDFEATFVAKTDEISSDESGPKDEPKTIQSPRDIAKSMNVTNLSEEMLDSNIPIQKITDEHLKATKDFNKKIVVETKFVPVTVDGKIVHDVVNHAKINQYVDTAKVVSNGLIYRESPLFKTKWMNNLHQRWSDFKEGSKPFREDAKEALGYIWEFFKIMFLSIIATPVVLTFAIFYYIITGIYGNIKYVVNKFRNWFSLQPLWKKILMIVGFGVVIVLIIYMIMKKKVKAETITRQTLKDEATKAIDEFKINQSDIWKTIGLVGAVGVLTTYSLDLLQLLNEDFKFIADEKKEYEKYFNFLRRYIKAISGICSAVFILHRATRRHTGGEEDKKEVSTEEVEKVLLQVVDDKTYEQRLEAKIKEHQDKVFFKAGIENPNLTFREKCVKKFSLWKDKCTPVFDHFTLHMYIYVPLFFVAAVITIILIQLSRKNKKLKFEVIDDIAVRHVGTDDPFELARKVAFYQYAFQFDAKGILPTNGQDVALMLGFEDEKELNSYVIDKKDPFLEINRHHKDQGDKYRNQKERDFKQKGKTKKYYDGKQEEEDEYDNPEKKQQRYAHEYMERMRKMAKNNSIQFSEISGYPMLQLIFENQKGEVENYDFRGNNSDMWRAPKISDKGVTETGSSMYMKVDSALKGGRTVVVRVYDIKNQRWLDKPFIVRHTRSIDTTNIKRAMGTVMGPCGVGVWHCSMDKLTNLQKIYINMHVTYQFKDAKHITEGFIEGEIILKDSRGAIAKLRHTDFSSMYPRDYMYINAANVVWRDMNGIKVASDIKPLVQAEKVDPYSMAMLCHPSKDGIKIFNITLNALDYVEVNDLIHNAEVQPGYSGDIIMNDLGEVIGLHVGQFGASMRGQTIRHVEMTDDQFKLAILQRKQNDYNIVKVEMGLPPTNFVNESVEHLN